MSLTRNAPVARQLSLFGVEAVEPTPDDVAGLLAAGGRVVRMGGTARVSIGVTEGWRVHVLVAELARRGLRASWVAGGDEPHGVRTAYATTLARLATEWLHGSAQLPPADFHLNGPRLRLWVAAAGHPTEEGYRLPLGTADEQGRARIGAALAAVGLPAVVVEPGAEGGPAYRISGRRRLARLAELVGDRPAVVPPGRWPGNDLIGG